MKYPLIFVYGNGNQQKINFIKNRVNELINNRNIINNIIVISKNQCNKNFYKQLWPNVYTYSDLYIIKKILFRQDYVIREKNVDNTIVIVEDINDFDNELVRHLLFENRCYCLTVLVNNKYIDNEIIESYFPNEKIEFN